jgi:hypothetical protein
MSLSALSSIVRSIMVDVLALAIRASSLQLGVDGQDICCRKRIFARERSDACCA